MAKARLDFEGIPCWVASDYHINLQWTISLALGGVKLKVLQFDYEDARKILNTDCSKELAQVGFPNGEDSDRCNKCGSHNLSFVNWTRKAAALSLLTGLPLIFFRKRIKCLDCGSKMKMN